MGSGGIPPLGPPVRQRTDAATRAEACEAKNTKDDFCADQRSARAARFGERNTRLALLPDMKRVLGDQANRAISTSKLNALLRLHTWPIDGVVFPGSQAKPGFEVSFPLRCFQRLSRPYLATRLCHWRDNRSTRDTFFPVLSY